MLEKIRTYFSISKDRLFNRFLKKDSLTSANNLCCLSVSSTNLTLIYTKKGQPNPSIELFENQPLQSQENFLSTLTRITNSHSLKNVMCTLMLQPNEYQLLVTDALPVTKEEFQNAIRWKIKDLILHPLNDVVIDYFALPKMKTGKDKIMVVVAQASKLKMQSDQIADAGLALNFIDIPELGLRNISALYEKDDQAIVLLYFQDDIIHLLITLQDEIYVSRRLKFNINMEDANNYEPGIERLVAEVNRSFDYYQSLWGKSLPSRFIFSSTKPVTKESLELLSQRLNTNVEMINLMEVLTTKVEISPATQGICLPVIGGALRQR